MLPRLHCREEEKMEVSRNDRAAAGVLTNASGVAGDGIGGEGKGPVGQVHKFKPSLRPRRKKSPHPQNMKVTAFISKTGWQKTCWRARTHTASWRQRKDNNHLHS